MTRKLSFENTHRLIEQSVKINDIIRESISNEMYETERKAIHDVNKAVFELAEERGVSIWDVCFHFVPQYDYSGFEIDDSVLRMLSIIHINQPTLYQRIYKHHWTIEKALTTPVKHKNSM